MTEIIRGSGVTNSERYLAKLADRTFLNLWSHPNVYKDVGKELCDLLIVCGDNVIIFSDKTIAWKQNADINIAWSRWYRRAVKESVEQARGAERWIKQFPDRLFLDARCDTPFPIKLPKKESMKIHVVVVALGAHEACSDYFDGNRGSFMIQPSLRGDMHIDPNSTDYQPFTIGDVDPSGTFVHVLNDVTLDILMRELDTITDFVEYLDEKEKFFRSGYLGSVAGEEELLAYYLSHMNDNLHHGFSRPDNSPWEKDEKLVLAPGVYDRMLKHEQYKGKIEANKRSYLWDRLITTFTDQILEGRTVDHDKGTFEIGKHEIGVRYMAQENRMTRRLLSDSIVGMLNAADKQARTFRGMMPTPNMSTNTTAYILMTLAVPTKKLAGGYDQYRKARQNMLQTYCFGMLQRNRNVQRIIGIAMEPPATSAERGGQSEDLVYIEQFKNWSPEFLNELDRMCEHFQILSDDRLVITNFGIEEYPSKTQDYSFKAKQTEKKNPYRIMLEAKKRKRR